MARRLRGMKQAHAAELLGVTQPTISRIERGDLAPAGLLLERLLDLVSARLDPTRDAGLRRLVENAALPIHLVCDVTHRLLAASRPREREWRRSAADLNGCSLWPFASAQVQATEATLADVGWGTRDGAHALEFATGANTSPDLHIAPGILVWERILLSDGSPARLVTRTAEGAPV